MCSALENKKFAWIITKFRTNQLNFPSLFFACIFFLKENSVQNCRKLAILYRADTSQCFWSRYIGYSWVFSSTSWRKNTKTVKSTFHFSCRIIISMNVLIHFCCHYFNLYSIWYVFMHWNRFMYTNWSFILNTKSIRIAFPRCSIKSIESHFMHCQWRFCATNLKLMHFEHWLQWKQF